MAPKKKQPPKPKLADTKPRLILTRSNNNGSLSAGTEPRETPVEFYETPEFRELSKDERRIVEEWLIDRNQTAAYYRAGFGAKSYESAAVRASMIFKRDRVRAAIAKAKELISDAVGEDIATVALAFKQIRDKALKAVPVLDREGNATGEYRFDSHGAISANKELGLAIGVLRNKTEITGRDGGPIAVRVDGVVTLKTEDLSRLSLAARRELLDLLKAKEESKNGAPAHEPA